MIDPSWRRIAGFHAQDDGHIGVVWLAIDPYSDVAHLYDAAVFKREVMAVVAEGISARGRWIPLAWPKSAEEFQKQLLNRGINCLPEPCAEKQSVAEVISREIWQRMRTSRFRVDQRVGEWLDEFRNFYRDESKVPMEGFPLMAATRYAVEMARYAKPLEHPRSKKRNHPQVSVV